MKASELEGIDMALSGWWRFTENPPKAQQ